MHCREEVAAFLARGSPQPPPPPAMAARCFEAFHREAHPKQAVDVTRALEKVECAGCLAMLALPGVGAAREVALTAEERVVLRRDRRGALAVEYRISPTLTEVLMQFLRGTETYGIAASTVGVDDVVDNVVDDVVDDVVEPCVVRLRVVDEEQEGALCTTNMVKDLVDLVVSTCLGMHLAVEEPTEEMRVLDVVLDLLNCLEEAREEPFAARKALLQHAHREVRAMLESTVIFPFRAVTPRWIQLEQAMKDYFHAALLGPIVAKVADTHDNMSLAHQFHVPWQTCLNRLIHGQGFDVAARTDPDLKDIHKGSVLRSRVLALSQRLYDLIAHRVRKPEQWGTIVDTRELLEAQLVLQQLTAECARLDGWRRDARRRYCGGHEDAEAFLRLLCFRACCRQLVTTFKDWTLINMTLEACRDKDPPASRSRNRKKKNKKKPRAEALPVPPPSDPSAPSVIDDAPTIVEPEAAAEERDDHDADDDSDAGDHNADDGDDDLRCPITMSLFVDPVLAADGNTYERAAIEAWFQRCRDKGGAPTSPLTQEPLAFPHLTRNLAIYRLVQKQKHKSM